MAESDFQTEVMRGMAFRNGKTPEEGGFGYKIADVPFSIGKQARFIPKKPFDCFWVPPVDEHGHARPIVFLELKLERGLSLNVGDKQNSSLKPHQEVALTALAASGQLAAVLVNFQSKLSVAQKKKRGVASIDLAYAATISEVQRARISEASDSLKLEWWEQHAVELPLISYDGRRAWDPLPLLEL